MKGFFNLFVRSAKELKNIRCLCVTAMLVALDLVLKFTLSIQVTSSIKISFAFIALSAIGMLYGPTVSFAAGLITDLLGIIIKPTGAFDIRFTLIEAFGALLYGLFLYNAKNDGWIFPRVVAAKTTVTIACNLFLTTFALASVMGDGFFALFPARAVKSLAQLPVDICLMCIFLPLILKAYCKVFKGARAEIPADKLVFSNENMLKAMAYIVCILLIIVGSLGIAGNDLYSDNSDLEDTITEQSEKIEAMQSEIDDLYEHIGIQKPDSSQTEPVESAE